MSRANTVEGTCHKRGNRDKEEISKRAIVLVNSGGINKRGKFSRKDILFYETTEWLCRAKFRDLIKEPLRLVREFISADGATLGRKRP